MFDRLCTGRAAKRGSASLGAVVAVLLTLSGVSVAASSPLVTTGAVTDVTFSSATLHGTVDPQGADTQYQFSYYADGGATTTVPIPAGSVAAGAGPTDIAIPITNLASVATYHVTLDAQNSVSNVSGSTVTFTTPVAPPRVSFDSAEVGETSVAVHATIVSSVDAHAHVEWGTTTSYGSSSPAPDRDVSPLPDCFVLHNPWWVDSGVCLSEQDAQSRDNPFAIGPLTPGTVYHMRLFAGNSAGTTYSDDHTVTTAALGPAPTNVSPPTLTGSPVFGHTLTCDPGSWNGASAYTYTWLDDGVPGLESSDPTYDAGLGDVGHRVACRVDATSPGDATGTATTRSVLVTYGPPQFAILTGAAHSTSRGTTTLRIACRNSFGRCTGTLTLTAPVRRRGRRRRAVLAHARVNLAPHTTASVTLKLDRTAELLLQHAARKHLRVRATLGSAARTITIATTG